MLRADARLQQLEGAVAASVAPRLRRAGGCGCRVRLHGAPTITVGAPMLPAAELPCAELELVERAGEHLGQVRVRVRLTLTLTLTLTPNANPNPNPNPNQGEHLGQVGRGGVPRVS